MSHCVRTHLFVAVDRFEIIDDTNPRATDRKKYCDKYFLIQSRRGMGVCCHECAESHGSYVQTRPGCKASPTRFATIITLASMAHGYRRFLRPSMSGIAAGDTCGVMFVASNTACPQSHGRVMYEQPRERGPSNPRAYCVKNGNVQVSTRSTSKMSHVVTVCRVARGQCWWLWLWWRWCWWWC